MNSHTRRDGRLALEELRRLALLVEYDGTRYHGFQAQRNAESIQETLEGAIHSFTGERLHINGAGRTDSGVHAQGQVVAFDTWSPYAPPVFIRALNNYLPEDISVKDAQEVSLDFNPRVWAVSREYRYIMLNRSTPSPLLKGFVHHVRRPLDTLAMQDAAQFLEGDRDFAPFSGPLSNRMVTTKRRMFKCSISIRADMVFLDMIASGFLPQQVRRTAGALLELGLGWHSLRDFRDLADCGEMGAATRVLPAKGLTLVKVSYPTLMFCSDGIAEVREQAILEASAI